MPLSLGTTARFETEICSFSTGLVDRHLAVSVTWE